ncbi:MAG: tetratricopeptide repeat protein [Bacteroidota bacterium]
MAKKIQQQRPAPKPIVQAPPPAQPKATPKVSAPRKPMPLHLKLALILGALAFLMYANTLWNDYVLDDPMVTTKNTIVSQGMAGIPEILRTPRLKGYGYFQNENYRPLSMIMFATEYEIFGHKAPVGHFFNVLFFALGVVMLFFFIDKLFDRTRTGLAFLTALLFALHPIHTEVVANIKSRDEIMCFFFGFWALNVFIDYMRTGKIWQLLAGTALFFLSFISKETVVAFLFVIPLVFFFYKNDSKPRAIAMTACAVVIAAIYITMRTVILKANNTDNPLAIDFIDNMLIAAPSVAVRLATCMYVLGYYIRLLLVPYPLNCDYCYNSIPFVNFGNIWVLLSVALHLFMAVYGTYRLFKYKRDPWAFAMLFYLAAIFLFSNIPFLLGAEMGERFVFFASMGFCMALALIIEKFVVRAEITLPSVKKNTLAMGVLVVVFVAYAGLTFARNNDWSNNYKLFKADLAKSPTDARLHFYYGDELAENVYPAESDTAKQRQIINESIATLKRAIEIYPKYTEAHVETGKAYFMALKYDSAAYHFTRALQLNPEQSIAANNLGTIYLRTGRYREAITQYQTAIRIKADFGQAYFNLGCTYLQTKQFDSAIDNLNKTLSFDPSYVDGYMQIGVAYYMQAKYDQAIPYFNKVIEMAPNNVDALNNLGAVYLNTHRAPQALEIFKRTVVINPNYVNGYSNMGHCYYEMKQYQATIDALTKALQLAPGNVKDIPYIALSYKALGNMAEAQRFEAIARQYYPEFKLL